jgi:hypothetical protein
VTVNLSLFPNKFCSWDAVPLLLFSTAHFTASSPALRVLLHPSSSLLSSPSHPLSSIPRSSTVANGLSQDVSR